jgi:hypothetical protein
MRPKHTLPLLLAASLAGCESFLDVKPISELPEESAITGPISARAAIAGLYDGLSDDDSYYGGDFYVFSDLSGDDVDHTGTFGSYRVADLNNLAPNNGSVAGIWDEVYRTIGRANTIIVKLPDVPGIEQEEKDQMLGEALFVRALSFHNAVKLWGDSADGGEGVPLRLEPAGSLGEASQITRATTGEVYAQIFADLDEAEALMSVDQAYTTASVGAVRALRARAHLYRENWAEAEAAAQSVVDMAYELAGSYEDLFVLDETSEDIMRISYTPVEYQNIGYYYRAPGFGGRWEIGPSVELLQAWSPGYTINPPGGADPSTTWDPGADLRAQYLIRFRSRGRAWSNKWPTGVGDEDLHVIRFAEVLLIKAEAEARQGGAVKLAEAVASLNPIRERAGLAPLVYGVDVTTQQEVLDAIFRERRLELAFEADRWPDLVRRGIAAETLGIEEFRELYPIPLGEIDVAPNLTQNPGY